MREAVRNLASLRQRRAELRVTDSSRGYNTNLLELIELGNLLDLSYLTASAAERRTESRGGHAREDFPDRDDARWLNHSMAWLDGDSVRLGSKQVDVSRWEPKPRTY